MNILLILRRLTKSLVLEIESFITVLHQECNLLDIPVFTKSAFVQSRSKISSAVFTHLSSSLIREFYTDNEDNVKLWRGFRVLAVDGSLIHLPITKELASIYGTFHNQSDTYVVQGRVSVLYDVLNHYIIDGSLSARNKGERELALAHLEFTKTKDLIIYDRGYPSFDFIYEHTERKLDFLIRVKTTFSHTVKDFLKTNKKSSLVKIQCVKNHCFKGKKYTKDTTLLVRLIRIELPSEETEVLITSLLDDKEYPHDIFKELYFRRWKIETLYDQLKNKLKIEYFSGYSSNTILQDFHAALFISNIQTLLTSEIDDELATQTDKKYIYKVNKNISYGILKTKVITLFFSDKPMEDIIEQLQETLKKNIIPIRLNRSYKRSYQKYRTRLKPKVTKNFREAM